MEKVVSITTPSFNRAGLVTETAESIFAQTYPYWEWVIVDDGSTDNSWEVLQSFAARDSRVKIFQRDREPKGACTCRNIAIENCSGDYLIFLDTDDILAPFCLEQRVKAMQQNPDCDFVIFPMLLFREKLDDLNLLWNVDNEKDDLTRLLTGDAVCQGTGPLWKKSSFVEIGMWREDLHLWQDIELHVRSFLWPMKYVKRLDLAPDVYLRVSTTSLSRSGYYSKPKVRSRITVLIYTCEKMREKNVLNCYKKVLRNLAGDICMSAILGGCFEEALSLMTFALHNGLLSAEECRRLRRYMQVRKYKLYKVKMLDQYYYKNAQRFTSETENTIGKISFAAVAQ